MSLQELARSLAVGATPPPRTDPIDESVRLLIDGRSLDSPTYRDFLEAMGVAAYTTDADGRITFYNRAAAELWGRRPELGELWCGSWRMYWPDGRPMPHDQCPMAIALKEGRSVRGYEGVAERPDGTRVAFVPYPTVVHDADGKVTGAMNVIVDVTERRRAEDALRAASTVKDEFLGLVSHELRTPVTTIFGNASLLRDRADLPQPYASMVADIAADAERLVLVVENLLLLTRAAATTELEREPQLISHVVPQIARSFAQRHPARTIDVDVRAHGLIVEVDRAYLELLVGNLLGNAHKYSPLSDPIEVVVRAGDGPAEAEVEVLDRGIGFSPHEADLLFTTFYRTEEARRTDSGLGLGLAACRRLVALLGGRIWARRREGGGSAFGFALPMAAEVPD